MKRLPKSLTSEKKQVKIENIPVAGNELDEEQLRLVAGGIYRSTFCPASCTYNCDTDYYRD